MFEKLKFAMCSKKIKLKNALFPKDLVGVLGNKNFFEISIMFVCYFLYDITNVFEGIHLAAGVG